MADAVYDSLTQDAGRVAKSPGVSSTSGTASSVCRADPARPAREGERLAVSSQSGPVRVRLRAVPGWHAVARDWQRPVR